LPHLISICGSLRAASYNAMVARTLPLLAPEGMTIKPSPPIDAIPHYNGDTQARGFPESVTALGESIRSADGLIIVTPEYNYSVPGVLKNAIDWVSRLPDQPFKNKPVAIQSASMGALGGGRAQYHLRQIMVFVEAYVFNRPEVMIPMAKGKFAEAEGELSDEVTRGVIKQQLRAFGQFVSQMKAVNEQSKAGV
jgi:chromate reductase, NAD(P)H dehydrogenase (quinone)